MKTEQLVLDKGIRDIAEILGEDPQNIKMIEPTWIRLLQRGVIITPHIHRWRGSCALTFDDLGLPTQEKSREPKAQQFQEMPEMTLKSPEGDKKSAPSNKDFQELMNLGNKVLIPLDYIKRANALDGAIRHVLQKYGFETYWGVFIPETAYQQAKKELDVLKANYIQLAGEIYRDWDELTKELVQKYTVQAHQAYKRYVRLKSDTTYTEEMYVERFITRILQTRPSREQVRDSFRIEIGINFIPLPSLLAEDIEKAKLIGIETEQSRLEIEMRRDVLDNARRQKDELLSGFMKDVVGKLRSTTYEAVTDVLESIRRNGNLHPRSVSQLRNLVDNIQMLNFYGDKEIDDCVNQVQSILAIPTDSRDLGDITARLRDIAIVTRSTLLNLALNPRSARDVGIPDVPEMAITRQSRNNIENGLDITAMPIKRQGRYIQTIVPAMF